MCPRISIFVFLCASAVGTASTARGQVPEILTTTVAGGGSRGPSPCTALVGSASDRIRNSRDRLRSLPVVLAGPAYIDLVQTRDWAAPTEVSYRGLTLEATGHDEAGDPFAVFEVREELGFCAPGRYVVAVDQGRGCGARILAVFDGLVLVEDQGALRYLKGPDHQGTPMFKLSWRSPFQMAPAGTSKPTARSSKTKPKSKKPRTSSKRSTSAVR